MVQALHSGHMLFLYDNLELSLDTVILFESWRNLGCRNNDHALAWFLAFQFCKRFYASHGLVPHVIQKEGLGYYGIQLDYVRCGKNGVKKSEPLGRITIAGDMENWRTGHPGDHGLLLAEQCRKGIPTHRLVQQALEHMNLPAYPDVSHLNCRHKRWGASFELIFEMVALLAIRNPDIKVWNHPDHTTEILRELDPKVDMPEHLGAFAIFSENFENRVVIAGDGRLLGGSGRDFWKEYMSGETAYSLALIVENMLHGSDQN